MISLVATSVCGAENKKKPIVPLDFENDMGLAREIACGCDENGNSTAYMLPLSQDKIYFYQSNSVKADPWIQLKINDVNGGTISGFKHIAASSTGDLVAVRLDNSQVVKYDSEKHVFIELPGKPSDLKIFKVCVSDKNNIYVIAKTIRTKRAIYKYNLNASTFDRMKATENTKNFTIALDGTFVAINDDGQVNLYKGDDSWTKISDGGDKYLDVAIQNKENIFAIKKDLSLVRFNSMALKFEPVMGIFWGFDKKSKQFIPDEDEKNANRPARGFIKICLNAGGMAFLLVDHHVHPMLGNIFHNHEAKIEVNEAQGNPAMIGSIALPTISGVSASSTRVNKSVKIKHLDGGRTRVLRSRRVVG